MLICIVKPCQAKDFPPIPDFEQGRRSPTDSLPGKLKAKSDAILQFVGGAFVNGASQPSL